MCLEKNALTVGVIGCLIHWQDENWDKPTPDLRLETGHRNIVAPFCKY